MVQDDTCNSFYLWHLPMLLLVSLSISVQWYEMVHISSHSLVGRGGRRRGGGEGGEEEGRGEGEGGEEEGRGGRRGGGGGGEGGGEGEEEGSLCALGMCADLSLQLRASRVGFFIPYQLRFYRV